MARAEVCMGPGDTILAVHFILLHRRGCCKVVGCGVVLKDLDNFSSFCVIVDSSR